MYGDKIGVEAKQFYVVKYIEFTIYKQYNCLHFISIVNCTNL